jgi:membrane protein required for colicin V production
VLLVAIGFIVYDRAMGSQPIPMVEESRSQRVFASFQANIDANIPSDAPGWILERYNDLTQACVGPATEVAPATPPTPETAPATGG